MPGFRARSGLFGHTREAKPLQTRATLMALLGTVALVVAGLATASPASALSASLQEVTSFGANPGGLRMFEYVPATVTAHPAIVVVLHFCGGSGPTMFNNTRYAALADQFGYVVIYPSVTRSNLCFDVNTSQALTHNGGSDPVSIVSMVSFVEQHNNGDPSRVFATGLSSGAMMTNVLLGSNPEVFKAGSAYAGVPFGCFAGSSFFNTTCANGQITMTPQQWGDLVRAAFPGFSGPRPRMQLWHGTSDGTLNFHNFGEEIKQWTNVMGLSQTPTATDFPQSGWTRTSYGGPLGGQAPVEAIMEQGVTHNIPIQENATLHFFGLDSGATTATPTPTPIPSSTPTRPPGTTATPTPSATPTRTATPGATTTCQITYTIVNQWNSSPTSGGFQANVTIKNTGTTAINGWTIRWTFTTGQTIQQLWNAVFTQTGANVSVTSNQSWNGTIPPGASIGAFGFNATWSGTNAKPTNFSLNGATCA